MQRRKFIQNLALLGGGLVISTATPARVLFQKDRKVKGQVLSKGKGVEGVVMSDGYSVVKTSRNGKYEFDLHPEAVAVFISTPSGYAFKTQDGIARHYRLLQDVSDKKEINFDLAALDRDDDEHTFLIWADPQVKNMKDVDKMMRESVPDVKKLVAEAGADALIHGITVGDIVWDELKLFAEYDKAVKEMGIPFFQCLGNHDEDYRQGGDETSDDTFQKTYGPTYYSFNRGKVHYVVMDNVRYLGTERDYDGWFQQHQLDWLEKDLQMVPQDRLIVLCVHIPVHNGVKNRQALYDLLGQRKVHIMSGHTHYHVNNIRGNIYEHNHGTVCGAWWTGPICSDGTPCGYGVYQVKGTELTWHYQASGKSKDHQLSVYLNKDSGNQQLTVNIWNYDPEWKTEYWIDGKSYGSLEQYEGFDPLAYSTMLGPDLPKPRGFAEPHKTAHLFRASLPQNAKEVRVEATDRFGRKYSTRQELVA